MNRWFPVERTHQDMSRLMITLATAATAVSGLAALPESAAAQAVAGTNEVVVYGSDPCPRSTDSQVYVCTRRPEQERYRLPQSQQLQGTRQQRQSWANKSHDIMTAGSTGTGSCSPVGPGGQTGCLTQSIRQNQQTYREQQEQQTAPEPQ